MKAHNNRQQLITCKRCGKEFLVSPSRVGIKKYCSRNCFHLPVFVNCENCGIQVRINNYKKNHGKHFFCSFECRCKGHQNRVAARCSFCGIEFKRKISQFSRFLRHFCSRDCAHKFFVGENHVLFCGGLGYGKEWQNIRNIIRKRDAVCIRCGKTKERNKRELDVHHIIPFEKFGYVRRLDAHKHSNLITLCRSCHKWTELRNVHAKTISD